MIQGHSNYSTLVRPLLWPLICLTVSFASPWPIAAMDINNSELNRNMAQDIRYERCLAQIFAHPMIGPFKQQVLQRVPASISTMDQLDRFCRCSARQVAQEDIKRQSDHWSYAFADRQKFYAELDQCALQNLDNQLLVIAFASLFENYLRHIVIDRIEERWPASITQVADEGSYQDRLSCVQQDLLNRCSRVSSLHMSYRCIRDFTTQHQLMTLVAQGCRNFGQHAPTLEQFVSPRL